MEVTNLKTGETFAENALERFSTDRIILADFLKLKF
jgi:hypothetical protein